MRLSLPGPQTPMPSPRKKEEHCLEVGQSGPPWHRTALAQEGLWRVGGSVLLASWWDGGSLCCRMVPGEKEGMGEPLPLTQLRAPRSSKRPGCPLSKPCARSRPCAPGVGSRSVWRWHPLLRSLSLSARVVLPGRLRSSSSPPLASVSRVAAVGRRRQRGGGSGCIGKSSGRRGKRHLWYHPRCSKPERVLARVAPLSSPSQPRGSPSASFQPLALIRSPAPQLPRASLSPEQGAKAHPQLRPASRALLALGVSPRGCCCCCCCSPDLELPPTASGAPAELGLQGGVPPKGAGQGLGEPCGA